jgi:hypothetical protein
MIAHKDLDVIANQVFFTIGRQRKREVMEQVRARLCVHAYMHMDVFIIQAAGLAREVIEQVVL